jgi:ABC-2 type transport system ATP-binding protein
MSDVVIADELSKHYFVKERAPGLGSAIRALFVPKYRQVIAVDRLSFTIPRGQIVAFLGPNGAGKTTTLKMLTGLLYPSRGRVEVAGHNPWTGGAPFKRQITLVLGSKQQLQWDLPAEESFRVNKAIYGIGDQAYKEQRDELVALLGLETVIDTPVRQLSLGERMKCELAAALLHRPALLMLDEPTLGLDVNAQEAVRRFLLDYRDRHNATILLTSHYMADVTALADRVLMINHGRLLYDGSLEDLATQFAPVKRLDLVLGDGMTMDHLARFGEVKYFEFPNATIEVPRNEASAASARILGAGIVLDLSIHDPPIEEVIQRAFAERSKR